MKIRHDSHDLRDRSPFGAVPVGGRVRLGLDVSEPPAGARCFVQVWEKRVGAALVPMECVSWGETARFSAELTVPEEGCLLWYCFVVETYDGARFYYGNNDAGLGGVGRMYDGSPKSYQITVYKPAKTPDWYKNGIAYQIFPDRFFRGEDWLMRQENARRPDGWKGPRRVLQQDWDDVPFYCRNEKGEVTRWAFFGGTLEGIREKLLYLKSLGVTAVYLNPIFEAASSHRYDTADYMRIDPALGDEDSLQALIDGAAELGIRIILDGVFSHTGADSRYFNRLGNYDTVGACQSKDSPYYGWYRFRNWPEDYECWWGVTDLPNVEELEPGYRAFICGEGDSVVRHWLRKGIGGWRLDVADELPDEFIRDIRRAMEAEAPDSVLLGEVWEDASNKESYGRQREYLLGEELHSAMNYPFRAAAVDFMLGRMGPEEFRDRLRSIQENYPPENFYGALNLIGSHDRQRVLTTLGEAPAEDSLTEGQRERYRLPGDRRELARRRLMVLSLIQFTMPGVPCIYYGDEAGAEGYSDPFNRGTYPWGREDQGLLAHYRMLAALRQQYPVLSGGQCEFQAFGGHVYGCRRWDGENKVQILANRGIFEHETVELPMEKPFAMELTSGRWLEGRDGMLTVHLEPLSWAVVAFFGQRPADVRLDRAAGVVCHVTAVPGRKGRADLTDGYAFVDFLAAAGQKLWQVLPLNPVGLGGSPYVSPGAFAGEPSLIDWEREPDWDGYEAFCRTQRFWLDDYVLYTAIREKRNAPWQEWPPEERDRTDVPALWARCGPRAEELRREQFVFWSQWAAVKRYANEKGVRLIGDLPLSPAADSADVWANRAVFQLDSRGYPKLTAGVPPDYYSPEGQNWGSPVYDWEAAEKQGYEWWIRRLQWAAECFDYVRLDHFRGFSEYYSIPAGKSGKWGGWRPGPGMKLFRAAEERLGRLPLLAEDLGTLDAGVYRLLALTGLPGMDVYQFDGEKLPAMDETRAAGRIFYGSTHDSQTLAGWCAGQGERTEDVIRTLYRSAGGWVMLQLQDLLGLGDEARFNTPGTVGPHNWSWQARPEQLDAGAAERFRRLAEECGR